MQAELVFSGPVSEGFADDDAWSVGGQEINPALISAVRELAEAQGMEEVAFAADLWLSTGSGYHPSQVGAVSGYIEGLVDEEEPGPSEHRRVTLRGDLIYDPMDSGFLLGPVNIVRTVMSEVALMLGPFIGADQDAPTLTIVLAMDESTGYDDLPVLMAGAEVRNAAFAD